MDTCHLALATPQLHELHWLLVYFGVQFKVLVIIFKALGAGLMVGPCLSSCIYPFCKIQQEKLALGPVQTLAFWLF